MAQCKTVVMLTGVTAILHQAISMLKGISLYEDKLSNDKNMNGFLASHLLKMC